MLGFQPMRLIKQTIDDPYRTANEEMTPTNGTQLVSKYCAIKLNILVGPWGIIVKETTSNGPQPY